MALLIAHMKQRRQACMDFLPGKSCVAVPLLMQEGWGWRGGAREDVNNALQGMRLVRSQGYGNLKAFVFVTQIRNPQYAWRKIWTDGWEWRMTPPFPQNVALRRKQFTRRWERKFVCLCMCVCVYVCVSESMCVLVYDGKPNWRETEREETERKS